MYFYVQAIVFLKCISPHFMITYTKKTDAHV